MKALNAITLFKLNTLLDRDYASKIDWDAYLRRNPDVKAAGLRPDAHFLNFGLQEGRKIQLKHGSICVNPEATPAHEFESFWLEMNAAPLYANEYDGLSATGTEQDKIVLILVSPTKAICLPACNLALFGAPSAPGKLWPITKNGDLDYAHLLSYRRKGNKIQLRLRGQKKFLEIDPRKPAECSNVAPSSGFSLRPCKGQIADQAFQEMLIANILARNFLDLSIAGFDKIQIDLILQTLPFEQWTPERLGISDDTIAEIRQIYPECRILGTSHQFDSHFLDLSSNYDWLAAYDTFNARRDTDATGASWGASHSIQNIWRRSVFPSRKICLVTSIRNEGPYILEFIAYYKLLGIDDIFIYSNDNDDGSDLLLEALARKGEIYYIRNTQGAVGAQSKSFAHAFSMNREILNYEWCLLVDMDEFLWINPENLSGLPEFLEMHEHLSSRSILINWIYTGSDSLIEYEEGMLLTRIRRCRARAERVGKTLFRTQDVYAGFCHFPLTLQPAAVMRTHSNGTMLNSEPYLVRADQLGKSAAPDYSYAAIYHYMTKSFDEFLVKCSRNSGDLVKTDGIDFSRITPNYFGGFLCLFAEKSATTGFSSHLINQIKAEIDRYLSDADIKYACDQINDLFRKKILTIREAYRKYLHTMPELAARSEKFFRNNCPYFLS